MSRPFSLRYQILRWLLVPLGALCVVGVFLARFTVQRSINAAYDKSLHAAALAISEHLRMVGARPEVDLPPIALEMLDTIDQDRIFYSVAYRSSDGRDVFITGYDDLPRPTAAPPGKALLYDADYRGERIRVTALSTAMPANPPVVVVTQVAETVGGRQGLIQTILVQALGQQLFLILLGGAIVWMGVKRGLAPLQKLSGEVARRTATDLAPLTLDHAPEEVSPLIGAIDQLMARVRDAIAVQRRFIADASHQLRSCAKRSPPPSARRSRNCATIRRRPVTWPASFFRSRAPNLWPGCPTKRRWSIWRPSRARPAPRWCPRRWRGAPISVSRKRVPRSSGRARCSSAS